MYSPALAEYVSAPAPSEPAPPRKLPALTAPCVEPAGGADMCQALLPVPPQGPQTAPAPLMERPERPERKVPSVPELGAQEPLLRQLCELTQSALYVVDAEHRRLLMVSQPCHELLGVAPSELGPLSAESLLLFIHPQDHAAVRSQLGRSLTGLCAPITECEFRFRRPDGEWRWLRNRLAVLSRDPLGRARHLIGSALDVTLQRKLPDRLARPSLQDSLTGVGNRTAFELELKRLSVAHGGPVSVLLVDLDGLRRINDSQGPEAGDDLLRRTAELLRENCRAEDLVARIGGDEFAVLLRYTSEATGRAVLARLRAAVAADTEPTPLRISLGLATASGQESIEGAIRRAECALFADKLSRRR